MNDEEIIITDCHKQLITSFEHTIKYYRDVMELDDHSIRNCFFTALYSKQPIKYGRTDKNISRLRDALNECLYAQQLAGFNSKKLIQIYEIIHAQIMEDSVIAQKIKNIFREAKISDEEQMKYLETIYSEIKSKIEARK